MSAKKLKIQKKKNQINRWLEISPEQEASAQLQRMIEAMKQENRSYFLEEEQILIYNTRELSNLDTYLRENASLEELSKILMSAVRLQETCINYLIPKECILFDFEYSYYDEAKKGLELIVLPFEVSEVAYPFQDWILKVINAFPVKEEGEIFLNRLYQLLQSQQFSIDSLKDELNREERKRKERMAFQVEKQTEKKETFDPPVKKKDASFEPFLRREERKKPLSSVQAASKRDKVIRSEERPVWESEQEASERIEFSEAPPKQHRNETKRMTKEKKSLSYKYFILYELLMLSALGLSSFYAYSVYVNPKKAIMGLAIIWGMINYFIGKELLKLIKERRSEEKEHGKENKIGSSCQKHKEKDKKNERAETKGQAPLCEETELLFERESVVYYLNDLKNKRSFELKKRVTLLGRRYEDVDIYLSDRSIGRVHAIISIENRSVFLQDNESLNGCYVNEKRLSKNERTELKEGDRIRFASFEFFLSSSAA